MASVGTLAVAAALLATLEGCGALSLDSPAQQDDAPPPQPPPGGPWRLAWAEEFNGATLNASRWNVRQNGTHGDLEQQLYVSDAVTLRDGHLVLRTARASVTGPDGSRLYNFTSGWVDTQGKLETSFGRWEIRARLPDPEARGIWPAHWLMPRYERGAATDWNCWPVGGEIDIMESTGGVFGNTVLGTYHWGANCSAGSPPPPPGPNCTCGCGCDLHKLSNTNGEKNGLRKWFSGPLSVLTSCIVCLSQACAGKSSFIISKFKRRAVVFRRPVRVHPPAQ
jgi:hypothetical protein